MVSWAKVPGMVIWKFCGVVVIMKIIDVEHKWWLAKKCKDVKVFFTDQNVNLSVFV